MTSPPPNEHRGALMLAKAIARLARVNTSIDRVIHHATGTDLTITLGDTEADADGMLAEAEDDIRLGLLLFAAVEKVEPTSRGIAKRPRRLRGIMSGHTAPARPATRHDAMVKAARVLRRALQKRFPLTWQKLLEE